MTRNRERERESSLPVEAARRGGAERALRLHYKSWESPKLITASEGCRKDPRNTLKRAHLHPRAAGCPRQRNNRRPPFASPRTLTTVRAILSPASDRDGFHRFRTWRSFFPSFLPSFPSILLRNGSWKKTRIIRSNKNGNVKVRVKFPSFSLRFFVGSIIFRELCLSLATKLDIKCNF